MRRTAVLLAAAASTALACASGGGRGRVDGPPAGAGDEPLQLLLRAELSDGADRATVRLTLRRWREDRFELEAVDVVGRRLWSLAVAGDGGLWRDARGGGSCRLAAGGPVRLGALVVPLAPRTLPVVLLGGLPVALPPGAGGAAAERRTVQFEDDAGGRWRVVVAPDGEATTWRLDLEDDWALEWERDGERRRLRTRSPRFEIVWREAARERLTRPEPPWVEPDAETPECGDEELP
jgi:hypothetical protein